MRGALPLAVVGNVGIWCLLHPMGGQHLSITGRSGEIMALVINYK